MIKKISSAGIKKGTSLAEIKRIKLLNQIALIFIIAVSFKLLNEIVVRDGLGVLIALIIIFTFTVPILLNKYGFIRSSRLFFTLIFALDLSLLNVLFGKGFGAEFGFFPFVMLVIIFHEKWQEKLYWLIVFVVLNILSNVFLAYNDPLLLSNLSSSVYYFMFTSSLFGVLLMSEVFIRENVFFKQKLEGLNSELKNKNLNLQTANQELEKFAFVASHDLKTPLVNIKSFLELITQRVQSGDVSDVPKFLNFASLNAERMQDLIEGILEFSRTTDQVASFESNNIKVLIDAALSNLGLLIHEKNAKISIGQMPQMFCNPTQITSLFQNLVENGIKYNVSSSPQIKINCNIHPNSYEFIIEDNGIGINAKYQDKVFEMFYRLHNRQEYEGTGIGLATCKKIATYHGGEISMDQTYRNGSRFILNIPKLSQDKSLGKPNLIADEFVTT